MKAKQRGEQLIIQLFADDTQPVLWLHAMADGTVAAQGSLAPGKSDPALMALIAALPATVLVPVSECVCHKITLPPQARRRALQVAPFMLEEQLATDIDRLHFALLARQREQCHLVAVEKSHMRAWLSQCERLGLQVEALLPDALMLPLAAAGWSAVRTGDQWLFRREQAAGMAVESCWLPDFLAAWPEPVVIHCYSEPPAATSPHAEWHPLPQQSLLQLAATQIPVRGKDLRHGEFSPPGSWPQRLRPWKTVMYALGIYLLLLMGEAGLTHYQLWQQAGYWQQESTRVYRRLLPQEKNVVNPRVQLQQHIDRLHPRAQTVSLNAQLNRLQQLFAQNRAVTLHALAYDAARAEMRLEVQASAYQELEAFQRMAARQYRLHPGEMKQGKGWVESQLTLEIQP